MAALLPSMYTGKQHTLKDIWTLVPATWQNNGPIIMCPDKF